jgi:hypothetical protein
MELQRGQTRLSKLFAMMAVMALLPVFAPATPARLQESCTIAGNVLITIENLQGGVVGQTGVRTTIGEDGCFTVDRVVNDKTVSRLRSGQLSPDRVARTRAAIEAAHITSLPDRSGTPPPVNPATLSITYQGVTKTVVAPSGTSIEGMTALGGGSLARLAARLLELTDF